MSKHTPEPWKLEDPRTAFDANWSVIFVSNQKDAPRIIACVNACAGMEDPQAEIDQLRTERDELMKALEKFTILNPAHYKDIAGLINNAAETLNRMKEAER